MAHDYAIFQAQLGEKQIMKRLFTGELMKCEHCGWQYKSDSSVESYWTVAQVDDKLIYFCPNCWGVPRYKWPKEELEQWKRDHDNL